MNRYTDEEKNEFLRQRSVKMYGLYTIGGEEVEKTLDRVSVGPRVWTYINKVVHSFLIDTGSPVNAIDESTYMALSN